MTAGSARPSTWLATGSGRASTDTSIGPCRSWSQSCTTTVIGQGQGLVFTTRDRPVPSRRGWSAAPMRHGVSVLRSGRRHTLGLVFHDAK